MTIVRVVVQKEFQECYDNKISMSLGQLRQGYTLRIMDYNDSLSTLK